MEKELKDYLPFYRGCECQTKDGVMILSSVGLHEKYPVWFKCQWNDKDLEYRPKQNNEVLRKECLVGKGYYFTGVKPILRKLSDMTEEEMKELYFLVFGRKFVGNNITHRDIGKKEERWVLWSGVDRLFIYRDGNVGADCDLHPYSVHAPSIVLWQLSKHFDIFGLIPAGLAIDKTTLNPKS